MKHNRSQSLLRLIVCAFALMQSPAGRANLMFDVSLNTSPLMGNPAGPFYIDFQLNDGSGTGDANSNIVIDSFKGGKAVNLFLLTIGGASGNLSSSVSITDSGFLNEFIQQFDPGSALTFRVSLSVNDVDSPTPDLFSFMILNSTFTPLPTTGLGNALLLVNIDSSKPLIDTFPTTDGTAIQPRVPETGSSFAMLLIGLGAIWCLRRGILVTWR